MTDEHTKPDDNDSRSEERDTASGNKAAESEQRDSASQGRDGGQDGKDTSADARGNNDDGDNKKTDGEGKSRDGGKRARRRKWLMRGLLVVVVVVAIGWALLYFLDFRWYASTDDAYVKGNQVMITPRVPGSVVSIGAEDGDLVKVGQILVQLDPSDAEVALQRAKAHLASTVRQVLGQYNNVNSAKAQVRAEQVALDKARRDYQRRKGLAASGAISQEQLSHARDAYEAARSSLINSQQNLNTSKVLVNDKVVTGNPQVQAAAAQLRKAYLNKAHSTMVAPVTGYVAERKVQVGQTVQPGTPLMAVVPLHQIWVSANFKETQLGQMHIGQKVTLDSDVYGGDVGYKGVVQSLGVGTGSAFSLLPAQNATGNWIKIVQRVPVRVKLTEPSQLDKHPLRIGMSMSATVNLHDTSGPLLSQTAPIKPVFSTNIYKKQLADADVLVKKIIHQNVQRAKSLKKSHKHS